MSMHWDSSNPEHVEQQLAATEGLVRIHETNVAKYRQHIEALVDSLSIQKRRLIEEEALLVMRRQRVQRLRGILSRLTPPADEVQPAQSEYERAINSQDEEAIQ